MPQLASKGTANRNKTTTAVGRTMSKTSTYQGSPRQGVTTSISNKRYRMKG